VHPVVRRDSDDAVALVNAYNEQLAKDGWHLVTSGEISGRPVFAAQRIGSRVAVLDKPTGWAKVDRQMQEVRPRLDNADTVERFQAVGFLSREVLITVAQEVFDEKRHPTVDEVESRNTDAKRMLEAFFNAELKGKPNKPARSHAKAAVELANSLQHKRT